MEDEDEDEEEEKTSLTTTIKRKAVKSINNIKELLSAFLNSPDLLDFTPFQVQVKTEH